MADKKKNNWLSYGVISIAFVAVITFLLIRFLTSGKTTATEEVNSKLINCAAVWAAQVHEEFLHVKEFSGMINDYVTENAKNFDSASFEAYLKRIVDNSDLSHILLCGNEKVIYDESHNRYEGIGINDLLGCEPVPGTFYPISTSRIDMKPGIALVVKPQDYDGCIVLCMETDSMGSQLNVSGYEDVSFLILFKKDGTICSKFNQFCDVDSVYTDDMSNFLSTIQAGTTEDAFGLFKSKIYNGVGYAISPKVDGESRTIACGTVGVDDWYIGFGVRQYYANRLINNAFSNVKSIVIKLAIVLVLFAAFVGGAIAVGVSRTREHGRKLENIADTDILTDLFNKSATERKIQEYMDEKPDGRGVMFILDIDDFKKVNDTMGHAFGDVLLKTLGKEIKSEFRLTDIVGRTGGDEFIVFLKDVKDNLIVEREANRITKFFHDFKAGEDYVKMSATASIGAAIYPDDASNFKDLYVVADQALYRAKRQGKNRLVFFDDGHLK